MFKRFGTHLRFCPAVLRKHITVKMLISYLAQKVSICCGWKKVVTTTGGTELVIYILNFSRSCNMARAFRCSEITVQEHQTDRINSSEMRIYGKRLAEAES